MHAVRILFYFIFNFIKDLQNYEKKEALNEDKRKPMLFHKYSKFK